MTSVATEAPASNPSPRWRVAVFPSGTEVGLEIHRALASCKEVALVGLSSPAPAPGALIYPANHEVPHIDEPDFPSALASTLDEVRADFIYPAHPLVIDALLDFREKLPAQLALGRTDAVRVARSKSRTYRALAGIVPLPRPALTAPAYVKPDGMYGGQEGRPVLDDDEIARLLNERPDLLVQELLPGREWTVDCLSDHEGHLLFASARTRERIRMGTSLWSEVADPEMQHLVQDYAERIAGTIRLDGPWFFQLKEDAAGVPRLMEVDPRIAGTMCLHRARGVNFPLLGLYIWSGREVSLLVNDTPTVVARSLRNHFHPLPEFTTVYVDLDDTLVVHGEVNASLVGFLFACRNRGVRIVLLSKSLRADPDGYLRGLALDGLVTDRIWLSEEDNKADHIDPHRAIFIDDSYSQRRAVVERHGIPTFSPDMVDALSFGGCRS